MMVTIRRQLKAQPNTAHIPVIFVTAKIGPEAEVAGYLRCC